MTNEKKIEVLKPLKILGARGSLSVGKEGTILYEAPGMPFQEEEAYRAIMTNSPPSPRPSCSCSMGVSGTPEQVRQYLADLY